MCAARAACCAAASTRRSATRCAPRAIRRQAWPSALRVVTHVFRQFGEVRLQRPVELDRIDTVLNRGLDGGEAVLGRERRCAAEGRDELPLKALLMTFNRDKGYGTANRGRYSNGKVDALTEDALAIVDDAKREA